MNLSASNWGDIIDITNLHESAELEVKVYA